MKTNVLKDKSLDFAIGVVNTCRRIQNEQKEFVLTNQLMRSGSAIGALYREAQHAESSVDFIHKLAIAQKEANETLYWIEILEATEILEFSEAKRLFASAEELLKLITSIIKSMKRKMQ